MALRGLGNDALNSVATFHHPRDNGELQMSTNRSPRFPYSRDENSGKNEARLSSDSLVKTGQKSHDRSHNEVYKPDEAETNRTIFDALELKPTKSAVKPMAKPSSDARRSPVAANFRQEVVSETSSVIGQTKSGKGSGDLNAFGSQKQTKPIGPVVPNQTPAGVELAQQQGTVGVPTPKSGKQFRQTPRSSKVFNCPLCPERPPFRYRKSFDKHMHQHQYESLPPSAPHRPAPLPPPPTAGGVGSKSHGRQGRVLPVSVEYDSDSESDYLEYHDDPADRDFRL
jgi:hypothetical protein